MLQRSVSGRLIRSTFCYGTEVAPVQCKRSLCPFNFIREQFK